jgi:hypothetical protein
MGWQDLVAKSVEGFAVVPWLGGRKIYKQGRTWRVEGALPRVFGWHRFGLMSGRTAVFMFEEELDPEYETGKTTVRGYVVGDRFIPNAARVDPDPNKLVDQTVPIFLVEPGLERFTPVQGAFSEGGQLVYTQQWFATDIEDAVRRAFVDRKDLVDFIPGVTPALDLAFRFATQQRKFLEFRRAELERKRLEEERLEQARKNMGTGLGRRTLAVTDFPTAAKAALAVGGAELLDVRPGYGRDETVVQYLFDNRRLECVVNRQTLRVIDSGICLTDHDGTKGDTYFTLESLPSVVRQAIREGKLVVYRHVDGDTDDWDH